MGLVSKEKEAITISGRNVSHRRGRGAKIDGSKTFKKYCCLRCGLYEELESGNVFI